MNKRMIILISMSSILLIYLAIFFNTNSVLDNVKEIMYGNVDKAITENTPLSMYNRRGEFGTTRVEAKLTRLFVLHDFFDGYMWVKYSYEGFDVDGNKTYGSWEVHSLWKIHRENGKWQIVEITEAP